MTKITIENDLKNVCPELALGYLKTQVKMNKYNETLWDIINLFKEKAVQNYTVGDISTFSNIRDARNTYRLLGKDPTRYRNSAEALWRRILREKELYQINNVVDINNYISLRTCFAIGTYDLDKLNGPICFRIGKKGEPYNGIGRGELNIENLPVFSDSKGSFGSPTSDSERTMVTMGTRRIIMFIISFSGQDKINDTIDFSISVYQQYAGATNIEKGIIA